MIKIFEKFRRFCAFIKLSRGFFLTQKEYRRLQVPGVVTELSSYLNSPMIGYFFGENQVCRTQVLFQEELLQEKKWGEK